MTEGGSDIIRYGLAGRDDGIIIAMALQFGGMSQELVNRWGKGMGVQWMMGEGRVDLPRLTGEG